MATVPIIELQWELKAQKIYTSERQYKCIFTDTNKFIIDASFISEKLKTIQVLDVIYTYMLKTFHILLIGFSGWQFPMFPSRTVNIQIILYFHVK